MVLLSCSVGDGGAIVDSLFRGHNHDKTPTFHAGLVFNISHFGHLFDHGGHHGSAKFLIGHFTASECDGDLGFVAFGEENFYLPHLNLQIMLAGSGP